MLSRKHQTKLGNILPEEWRSKIEELLTNVYSKECQKLGKSFQVHGLTYSDELYLSVGLIEDKHPENAPVSYIMSLDLDEKADSYEANLETLVDSMGVFFDTFFATPNWNEYVSNWTEASFKNIQFHYKVSRENVALSIQAEILLNQ